MPARTPISVLTFALTLAACGTGPGKSSAKQASGTKDADDAAGENAAEAAENATAAAAETVATTPLALRPAAQAKRSPFVAPADDAEKLARAKLDAVVRKDGLDPDNAWAVAHALIVYGPDVKLADERDAVDVVFERWAEARGVGGVELASFPSMRGRVPVQPHPGLMLKSLAEAGVDPDRKVKLSGGAEVAVASLFREAAYSTYASETGVVPSRWDDTPWLLQGLATWAPQDFAWTAGGGHRTDMDALTHALALQLESETKFLRDAMASGQTVQKRKQGIFAYTCGGQHMIQGVAYALARGFGTDEDRARMAGQLDALLFRIDIELGAVDTLIEQAPQYRDKLLAQRLKYLGHTLETGHKMAALGVVELDDSDRAALQRVRRETVATVERIVAAGLYDDLASVRQRDYQLYLDLVGDAAHALRGFALADGSGSIAL